MEAFECDRCKKLFKGNSKEYVITRADNKMRSYLKDVGPCVIKIKVRGADLCNKCYFGLTDVMRKAWLEGLDND